jgi:hypothetical protein
MLARFLFGSNMFRQSVGAKEWHWYERCPKWPVGSYATRWTQPSNLCKECLRCTSAQNGKTEFDFTVAGLKSRRRARRYETFRLSRVIVVRNADSSSKQRWQCAAQVSSDQVRFGPRSEPLLTGDRIFCDDDSLPLVVLAAEDHFQLGKLTYRIASVAPLKTKPAGDCSMCASR